MTHKTVVPKYKLILLENVRPVQLQGPWMTGEEEGRRTSLSSSVTIGQYCDYVSWMVLVETMPKIVTGTTGTATLGDQQ